MYVLSRHVGAAIGFLAALLVPAGAQAWVETATQAHVVTLDVERDGSATVSHEIVIRVKGGPLMAIELDGVDADAAPMPDATVASAEGTSQAIPLLLERRDDGTLRAEVDHAKGVSRGKYVFKLAYRTRLADRGMIRQHGSMAEVRWVAPRSTDGVDSARVLFRLPPGGSEPRLPESDEESGGTFLSNLRRTGDKDELDIVRPHVAKGEPVVWRVLASPKAFDAFGHEELSPTLADVRPSEGERPRDRLVGIALLVGVALGSSRLPGSERPAESPRAPSCRAAGGARRRVPCRRRGVGPEHGLGDAGRSAAHALDRAGRSRHAARDLVAATPGAVASAQ